MARDPAYRRRPSDYIVIGVLLTVVLGGVGGWFLGPFGGAVGASIGGTFFAVGVIAQAVLVGMRTAWRDQALADARSRQLQ